MRIFRAKKQTTTKTKPILLASANYMKYKEGYAYRMADSETFLYCDGKLEVGRSMMIINADGDTINGVIDGEYELAIGKFIIIKDFEIIEINEAPTTKAKKFSNLLKNRR